VVLPQLAGRAELNMASMDPKLEEFLSDAPVFLQPWWLEAVAPGRWDYVTVRKGNEIAAVLPYSFKKRLGWTFIESPANTPYLGPWLRTTTAKQAHRLSEEKELYSSLIESLPPHAHFHQNFHPQVTNWLPFYWKGFSQQTIYTYRLADTSDLDAIWEGMRENIRRNIRKARKTLTVESNDDFSTVLALHRMTWKRQGGEFACSDEEMFRIFKACRKHGAGKLLVAKDAENRAHCAAYFIWDRTALYYYFCGSDPSLRNSGANALIIWEGIRLAAGLGKIFDFEGSVQEPIERFFRAFGACQVPFFALTRTKSLPAVALREVFRRLRAVRK